MSKFEFITDEAFRSSLESDYRELQECMGAECWKAVLVLAGSIVEALLVDYLLASEYKQDASKDPLRMTFEDVIQACNHEGALSTTAANLSDVVRGYRNLIHPGRVIRLGVTPDANKAKIATVLVNMIAEEVAEKRQSTLGRTAEQIVGKLGRDRSAAGILPHLLREAKPHERERLLLKVIPEAYFQYLFGQVGPEGPYEQFTPTLEDSFPTVLRKCFREAFEMTNDDVKKRVATRFVSILREEDEWRVLTYETAFFRATDMEYLSDDDRELAKAHLLSELERLVTLPLLEATTGIGRFLECDEEMRRFLRSLVRVYLVEKDHELRGAARGRLTNEYERMTAALQESYEKTLESIGSRLPTEEHKAMVMELISDVTLPF